MTPEPRAGRSGKAHPGAAIRATRKAAGLSLDELAKLIGTDKGYLSRVERGERNPSVYWLDRASRVLADVVIGRAS